MYPSFYKAQEHAQVSHMITSTLAKAKDHLSSLLRQVQAGETLIILDRKKPIARVERIEGTISNIHLIPPRQKWAPREVLDLPIGSASTAGSVTAAVNEEREGGW